MKATMAAATNVDEMADSSQNLPFTAFSVGSLIGMGLTLLLKLGCCNKRKQIAVTPSWIRLEGDALNRE